MSTILDKVSTEIYRLLEENVKNEVSDEFLTEVVNILKSIDPDMRPIHELFLYMVSRNDDSRFKTIALKKLLEFYGLCGNNDILKMRQKIVLIDKRLVKETFLKKKDKEAIKILLEENNFYK